MPRIFQVDAFTRHLFGGNPAAVVLLESWPEDSVLQAVAAENNLAETAFLVPLRKGWELRWFTPSAEVALCGHATLAAAHVLLTHLGCQQDVLVFQTRQAGELTVTVQPEGALAMSFPAIPVLPADAEDGVSDVLGITPQSLWHGHYSPDQFDYVAVLADETQVRSLEPELSRFGQLRSRGVIVTAVGKSCDFVSRYFAPEFGINEDPVTGSAHCLLAPYWAKQLGKLAMQARQLSARGGELQCTLRDDRVELTGHAVDYLEGTIAI